MIKITAGDDIKRYAAIYVQQLDFDIDEAIDAVVEWVSSYVNGPWPEGMQVEATERERLDSIKGYIKAMINCSTYGRIKQSLAQERKDRESEVESA